MNRHYPILESGLRIGDYTLSSLISSDPDRQIWSGQQVSVNREVELVCYYGSEPDAFLADIRIKATVEDGVFGLVYEAVPTEEFIAFAREILPSKSLASIAEDGQQLLPVEVSHIIGQVANTLQNLDHLGIARNHFDATDIRLGPQNAVRIRNFTKAGPIDSDQASREAFITVLRKLLEVGQPGATRMTTLLDYIEGTDLQPPISWSQAAKLAQQVAQELNAPPVVTATPKPLLLTNSAKAIIIAAVLFITIAVILVFFKFPSNDDLEGERTITVPEARYPRPDGGFIKLKAFQIDATEVTIADYAAFMFAWRSMSPATRKELYPTAIAEDKTTIQPAHWNQYFPLARAEKTWQGRKISLDCPVIGLDWWDAQTFANWKGGRLPTEQEWWAANHCSAKASSTQSQLWGPVGGPDPKIYGLWGNVSEWAADFTKNPDLPIDSAKPVVLGGSFKKPSKDGKSREWVAQPSLQREDIGFRLVYPEQ